MSTSTGLAGAPAGEAGAEGDPRPGPPAPPSRRRAAAGRWWRLAFAAVVLTGVVLRFVAPSALWLDEAQSVAIARLPLPGLFDALRQDGSPPLYYLLLHGWIGLFGTGAAAVRSLSGIVSVLTLPLAWALGRGLAGRRVATALVLVLASSPFALRYASETRMYSLIVLLTVLGGLALRWVLLDGRPRAVLGLAAVASALLYTHYWAMYVLAAVGLLALAGLRRFRRPAVRVLVALTVGAVSFLPWVPSLAFQAEHTGTPWASQHGWSVVPSALSIWLGDGGDLVYVLGSVTVLLILLALAPAPVLQRLRLDRLRSVRLRSLRLRSIRVRRPARWSLPRAGGIPAALLAACILTLALAGIGSVLTDSAVAGRYTSVAFLPFVLLVALGASALPWPRLRAAVLTLVVVVGFVIGTSDATAPRTQAAQVAAALAHAHPGDVVVFCPDQLGPSVSRLAPHGLDLVDYPDLRPAGRVDWTDYAARNQSMNSTEVAAAVLVRAQGATVWVVTGHGYRVPSDARCMAFVGALAAARGPGELVVRRNPSVFESQALWRFPGTATFRG